MWCGSLEKHLDAIGKPKTSPNPPKSENHFAIPLRLSKLDHHRIWETHAMNKPKWIDQRCVFCLIQGTFSGVLTPESAPGPTLSKHGLSTSSLPEEDGVAVGAVGSPHWGWKGSGRVEQFGPFDSEIPQKLGKKKALQLWSIHVYPLTGSATGYRMTMMKSAGCQVSILDGFDPWIRKGS